ncbi:hypothetical protein F2Q70_00040465 [Brassica cretica]|uniref:Uncharacterized protein n=1 Tax=Brassica cretica TaxID=69181 RepID=A0A8S9K412_BRACR|nr:hypothetical protein F2Q70_00040465 [Brassica cretica]
MPTKTSSRLKTYADKQKNFQLRACRKLVVLVLPTLLNVITSSRHTSQQLAQRVTISTRDFGYSALITFSQLLGADHFLTVTRIALSQSLNLLSRSYSVQIVLSQSLYSLSRSLGLLPSLRHDVIPQRHVHPSRFDCDVCRLTLHPWQLVQVVQNTVHTDRSRNHPRSKKSDWNQKFVDDSSPGTVRP